METGADKASPELEFGTFLRLPHQSRTFSRPADSYIPSSPPSRPTSPTPASPPPPGVFLHGRPAPITSKMRQGAPRLGGLGLGGIVESPPTLPAQPPAPAPPPLPARRAATPSRSPKRSSFPPAVPPAAPLSSSSRSDSPGSVNGRPDTPNSAKAELNGGGASIQRPFLSPEMDKPVAREGAFALDRPKVEDVLRKSTDEDAPQPKELAALDSIAPEPTDDDTTTQDPPEAASPEGFPSPGIAEEENTDIFDRFKSTLADDPKDGEHEMSGTNRAREETNSDRASIRSTGESLFATPETVAASDEEEPVPTLALDNREAETAPAEEEEIAFDGPSQLLVEETPEPQQLNVASTDSQDATPMVGHSRTFEQKEEAAELRSSVSGPSLADALVARADKSASSDGTQRSPAVSVATSVYNSREPSINGLDLGEEEEEERPFSQSLEPSTLKPANPVSDFSISPTYSQTSSLPDGLSPNYTQGVRHLDDPASQYPSPPSSPATSIQASPLLTEGNHLPQVDDSSIYSVDESNKPSSRDTEFIEDVPQPSAEIPPKPVEPISYPSEPTPAPLSTERAATPVTPIASLPSSPSSSSPYFDRSTSGAPRRSRFSYQGLGLRMPSSIAPKDVDEPLLTEATSAPIPVIPQKQSQQPRPDAAEPKAPLEANSESAQREATNPTSALFPWLQPSSQREAPSHDTQREEEPSNVHREAVSGYRDETLYPSSPSAYAPSTVTSSPEITQAYRVPVGPTPVKVVSPVVSAAPQLETTPDRVEAQRPVPAAPSQPPTVTDHEVKEAQVEPRDRQEIDPSSSVAVHKGSSAGGDEADPNQLSGVGVAVDIGTAVAGALVMGGLAVGQSAWRGLAVGWSAWRGASNQPVMQETKVLEVSDIVSEREEENKAFKSYVGSREPIEEHDGSKKAESSVISTEWGEAEFDAPEGFLEEFKKAMAEIGEEDLAANEQAQIDAQLAAYQTASLQHMDAVASPTFSDNTSLSSSPSTSSLAFPPSNRIARQRESSTLRAPPPETIEEDSADEDEREIEDLMAPVWDSPSRQSRRSLDFPTRHGFTPPPGLTGSPSIGGRPISMISTSSVGSMRSFTAPQAPPSAPSSPRQPAKLSKTSKGILGFGRSKSTSKLSKPASRVPPSPSLPGLTKSQSVLSKESSKMDDSTSQHSKTSSHKTSGRRSSIFNFGGPGKDVPPVPTIESQIKDTTYISYGRAKPERRISNASIPADLYASRDPYLITPEAPGGPALSPSRTRTRTRELTPSSVTSSGSWTNRSEDLGGAPLGRRKSSLRSGSAYDGTSQLTRSSSIVEGGKKLYRVRFGNAMGGIGLRSVADSEAERAGGDRHGQRWVGIGRGRYGNMVIKTDEESDLVYAEQVAQIKKKWRAFGSEQSRDWAAVQIDK